jgi:hypothetical protein
MPFVLQRVSRLFACLLLIAQIGLIAHRIEHYILPDQMESGEDSCAAFLPAIDAPPALDIVTPPVPVVYSVRFWTVSEAAPAEPGHRLGFRAHAPPV